MNYISKNIRLLLALAATILIGVVVFLVVTTPIYKGFSLHKTPFQPKNFSSLQENSILSYSGLAFYKTSLDTGEVTVLHSGTYLPVVNTLNWTGEDGAILTFTDSGLEGSRIEQELSSRNLTWDDRVSHFAWYLDFKTGTLRLVDELGLATPATYYSEDKKGFYYIKYGKPLPESDAFENSTLSFYSTADYASRIVTAATGDEETTIYIGPCKTDTTICLIKQNQATYSLYAVENDKQIKLHNETYHHITATASPSIFIGAVNNAPEVGEESEDEFLRSTLYYIDLGAQKQIKLTDDVVASSSLVASTLPDGPFYILSPAPEDTSDRISLLTGNTNLLGTRKVKWASFTNSSQLKEEGSSIALLDPMSHNKTGFSMVHDTTNAYLVSPKGYDYKLQQTSSSGVIESIQSCLDTHTGHHDFSEELNQFKIGITYDDNYANTIRAFSRCVNQKDPKLQIGYYFVFVGLSPIDGRFVTN